jgi:DNA-binding transcriptional ArsR family regulator
MLWILANKKDHSRETPFFPSDFFFINREKKENSSNEKERSQTASQAVEHFDREQSKGHVWETDQKFFDEIYRGVQTEENTREKMSDRPRSLSDYQNEMSETVSPQKDTYPFMTPAKRANTQDTTSKNETKKASTSSARKGKKKQKSVKKSSRRKEAIVSLIRKEGDVAVKDVSKVIQGLSEKTLQRELTSLVDEGVLKKEGERRWSRYSIG